MRPGVREIFLSDHYVNHGRAQNRSLRNPAYTLISSRMKWVNQWSTADSARKLSSKSGERWPSPAKPTQKPVSFRRSVMRDLSSFATSRLRVRKEQCLTQRRKVAKKPRAMQYQLAGTVPVQATEFQEIRHERSFSLCVFASLREKRTMSHAKAQGR